MEKRSLGNLFKTALLNKPSLLIDIAKVFVIKWSEYEEYNIKITITACTHHELPIQTFTSFAYPHYIT